MGEVYRAKDPRVNREVAVKVLPEDLFEGEERKQRFGQQLRFPFELERDPKQRLQAIGESRIALERTMAGSSNPGVGAAREAAPALRASRAPLYLASAVAAAAGALALRARAPEERVYRSSIPAPEGAVFSVDTTQPGPPALSPDGRKLAFAARGADAKVHLYVRSLSGYLLFMHDAALMAQKFDASRLRLEGEPHPVLENVSIVRGAAKGTFSASQTGVLVAHTGDAIVLGADLERVDRAGKTIAPLSEHAPYEEAVISPEGDPWPSRFSTSSSARTTSGSATP